MSKEVLKTILPLIEQEKFHTLDVLSREDLLSLYKELSVLKDLKNPQQTPSEYLPFFILENQVDFWDEKLNEKEKRDLLEGSLLLHKYAGTPWALEKVIDLAYEHMGLNGRKDVRVLEWFNYEGEAPNFKIEVKVGEEGVNLEVVERFEKLIMLYKNVRSRLETLELALHADAKPLYEGAHTNLSETISVHPFILTQLDSSASTFTSSGVELFRTLEIGA